MFIVIDSNFISMYINREQNDHWNYFYHTIAWACVYLFMDAIWIMNVKHLLTFSKIQSGIFNGFVKKSV